MMSTTRPPGHIASSVDCGIGLGMIVHPRDSHLLAHVLGGHAPAFNACSVVIDSDGASPEELNRTESLVRGMFAAAPARLRLAVHALGRDFAAQRNCCAELNPCSWLLMLDADERIRVRTLKCVRPALAQVLESRPQVRVIGLARDNSLDGRTLKTGQDWQYRLVRRDVRWRNTCPGLNASPGCHELPTPLHDEPEAVVALEHLVIIHEKTTARQVAQNRFYEACA